MCKNGLKIGVSKDDLYPSAKTLERVADKREDQMADRMHIKLRKSNPVLRSHPGDPRRVEDLANAK